MLISNIQRFCLHDGPGIRTVVFLAGCPVRCFWCCNPEAVFVDNPNNCFVRECSDFELMETIMKDYIYYENGGGVTFSGGECLLQLKDRISLLKSIKEKGISIGIESSLCVDKDSFLPVINYIDFFFIDLKVFTDNADKISYKKEKVLTNLQFLKNRSKDVVFRVPLIKDFNDSPDNLSIIKDIINDFQPLRIEIFQIHNLGKEKYKKLNLDSYDPNRIADETMENIKNYFGDNCSIISF